MVDLSQRTIKNLFEQQIRNLTFETRLKENQFYFQLNRRWLS